jgi:glycine/D-amino acid oxidase-like deaminating enzyme
VKFVVGIGFKLGPMTGTMVADLAMGIKPRQEVEQLSMRRFNKKSNL